MDGIRKLRGLVQKVQIGLGGLFISIFLGTVLIQIVSRYIQIPVTWSEDIAKYSFVWAVFMGSAWAVARNEHFAFTALGDKLTGKKKIIHSIIIYLITMIFTIAMIKYGFDVTLRFWNYNWANIPAFKMGYVWMSLPVTGITMTFYLTLHVIESFILLKKGGDE